ncbi:MAG: adenylyl-sulfate kinase [Perlucidibaca sp.]
MKPNDTVVCENIVWHECKVSRGLRSEQKQQQPCILWFTGLSGAGKSTLANAVEVTLFQQGYHSYLLDGDNVRHGLNKDLSFSDKDRVENIRRVGEVSALMVDAGLIVLAAFISPFRSDRQMVRSLVKPGEFIEIHVATPLLTCEQRDPKGLYQKARSGLIKNFTGIDSDYEAPEGAELCIDTSSGTLEQHVDTVIAYLNDRGMLRRRDGA